MKSVEVFVGAGGLALGTAQAGFEHEAVIELDHDACTTIQFNQENRMQLVASWKVFETDAKLFDYRTVPGPIDLVAGGPPCQPFSIGGKHKGHQDERDMFPEAVRAVRELQPRAFLFENVKGLLRRTFATYFEYIILQLTYPEVTRKKRHTWADHKAVLEKIHTSGHYDGLQYRLVFSQLNAANYGVPQKRERVIIVGFRRDLGVEWSFPKPSYSFDALLVDQWITGDYWERHKISCRSRPNPPDALRLKIEDLSSSLFRPTGLPWRTVRDAISDLPDPEKFPDNAIPNHEFIPGARSYPGHTGSSLDLPAKTLKAGDHGVPGGENTLATDNRVRYFTVRESARLQTFPEDYIFNGSWTENMRQLGNAVPVLLSRTLANSILAELRE